MSIHLPQWILDKLDKFSDAFKAKLEGIEAGAQVNPDNTIKTSMIDGSLPLNPGEILFYNGSSQIAAQSDITTANTLHISVTGATYGQDASDGNVSLTSVNLRSYFNNKLNKGGPIFLAIQLRGETKFTYVQAETIVSRTGGWTLTGLTWYGSELTGTGDSVWNVICGSDVEFTQDIVDFIDGIEAAFHPKPTDYWLVAGDDYDYWKSQDVTGSISFFTGAPSASTIISVASAFNWSTITRVYISATAWDNPNYFQDPTYTIPAPTVGLKLILHSDVPYVKSSYATVTVTAVTTTGTGDAKYYELTVTTTQTGPNFSPGNNLLLRVTDEPPIDVTVPGSQVEVDDTFVHRIHTLEGYPQSLFAQLATKLAANPVASYVNTFLTALRMKLNAYYVELTGVNVSGISIQSVAKVVVQTAANAVGNISLATLFSRYVEKRELVGDDTADFYSQYQALTALLDTQTINKRGAWGLGTNASGAPSVSDTINESQVNDGSYTLVLGATQQNPDWTFKSPAYTASDFESGDILYAHPYDPYDKDNYFKLTLTANGTLVGTGNAAYIYAACTVDEVGSVTSPSDGWRFTETPPTNVLAGLRGRLIASGIPSLSQASTLLTGLFQKVSLARLGKHIRPDTTEPTDIPSTFETTNANIKNGNNLIGILNPVQDGAAQIKWGLGTTVNDSDGNSIAESDIADRLNVHHDITITAGSTVLIGTVNNFSKNTLPGDTHYLINLMDASQTGTFTDGETVTIVLSSNLVGRDEFVAGVLTSEDTNLAGKGGSQGQAWLRGTTESNAAWGTIISTIRAFLDLIKATRAASDRKSLIGISETDENALALYKNSGGFSPTQVCNVTLAVTTIYKSLTGATALSLGDEDWYLLENTNATGSSVFQGSELGTKAATAAGNGYSAASGLQIGGIVLGRNTNNDLLVSRPAGSAAATIKIHKLERAEPGSGGPTDINSDYGTALSALAGSDKFIVSDDDATGKPTKYITADNVKSFMKGKHEVISNAYTVSNSAATLKAGKNFSDWDFLLIVGNNVSDYQTLLVSYNDFSTYYSGSNFPVFYLNAYNSLASHCYIQYVSDTSFKFIKAGFNLDSIIGINL